MGTIKSIVDFRRNYQFRNYISIFTFRDITVGITDKQNLRQVLLLSVNT